MALTVSAEQGAELKARVTFAYAALCLLLGSGWLASYYVPSLLTGPARLAVHSSILWVVFAGIARVAKQRGGLGWRKSTKIGVCSVLLFGAPTLILAGSETDGWKVQVALVASLIPAVVVFLSAQREPAFGADAPGFRLLPAALTGFGGAALLLPFTLAHSTSGRVRMALLVAASAGAGWAIVEAHALLRRLQLLAAAAVCAGSLALSAACFAWAGWRVPGGMAPSLLVVEVLQCLLLDGPVLLLTLFVLREFSPAAFASKYFLVPLVTMVEGALMLRPKVGWSMSAGMLLLAGAGLWLLLADSRDARAEDAA